MKKISIVAPVLLAASLFASLQSCKKKSDASPANRITSVTDSVVSTGAITMTMYVSTVHLSYNDNKLSSVKVVTKQFTTGGVSYDSSTRTYSYADNKCVITSTDGSAADTVYLDGDKVVKLNSYTVTFFDGTSNVRSFRGAQYNWVDYNLSSIVGSDSTIFTYNTSKDASLATPVVLGDYMEYGRLLYNNKNLISSVRQGNASGGQNISYDYTFDGSGRITNVIQTTTAYGTSSSSNWTSYFSYTY